jgi:Arc/MetJ-type ribon-helix-helix transcriptional regulator
MFGSYKVKIEGDLLDQVKQCVEAGDYESVDEFVVRVLEKEIKKILPPDDGNAPSKELVKKRLQGLGYID